MRDTSGNKERSRNTFIPKRRLGQNFLVSRSVLSRMVDSCDFKKDELVLEIGPGRGALTRCVLPLVRHILAVETDKDLAQSLSAEFPPDQLTVIHQDFLKYDLSGLQEPIKLIGNLPYYISTPIITKVLENRKAFSTFFLTVQLEFGKRLIARPGTKDYSSMTCFVNYFTHPRILFEISSSAFQPTPKVRSCFMRLDILEKPAVEVRDESFFLNMIRLAFLQRRKMLLNVLGSLRTKEELVKVFTEVGVSVQARAEELTLEQFAAIANRFSSV